MPFAMPRKTPGPSPWFPRTRATGIPGFYWQRADDGPDASGKTLLIGQGGIYAILSFYNYVLPLSDGKLALWHQRMCRTGPTPPVVLTVLCPERLSPLTGSKEILFKAMQDADLPLLYQGAAESTTRLETTTEQQEGIEFSRNLSEVEELLILCHSSFVRDAVSPEHSNLALMVVNTKGGSLRLYPQDWFNDGGFDYGYE